MSPTAEHMVEEDPTPVYDPILDFGEDPNEPILSEVELRMERIREEVAHYEWDYCYYRCRGPSPRPLCAYGKFEECCSVAQYKTACATNSLCLYCLFLSFPTSLAACYIPGASLWQGFGLGTALSAATVWGGGIPAYCYYYHRCDPKEEE